MFVAGLETIRKEKKISHPLRKITKNIENLAQEPAHLLTL